MPRCPFYRPRAPGERACESFIDEAYRPPPGAPKTRRPEVMLGGCAREDQLMCVEWTRVYEGVVDDQGLLSIRKKERPPP